MKKKFVEPEIVRIELTMTENIATSAYEPTLYMEGFGGFWITTRHIGKCYDKYIGTEEGPIKLFDITDGEIVYAFSQGCFTKH